MPSRAFPGWPNRLHEQSGLETAQRKIQSGIKARRYHWDLTSTFYSRCQEKERDAQVGAHHGSTQSSVISRPLIGCLGDVAIHQVA